MPEKISPYASYGEKLIKLFAKLLFSGRAYSLGELSRMLDCSKQTVLRLIDDIKRSYGVEIEEFTEGRQKFYKVRKSAKLPPALSLTENELDTLMMCRAFAEHLLGSHLFEEASQALEKSQAQLNNPRAAHHFTAYRPGSIDYTRNEADIRTILNCMQNSLLCQLSYRPLSSSRAKSYTIMPLKIFSHGDTIYVSARLALNGEDRLFATHRIQQTKQLDESFIFPKDYDFEQTYNQNFGIIKGESFEALVAFSGFAAQYVAERNWSPDQKITKQKDGGIRLRFSASSKPELIAWILSFGPEALVLKPGWLREEIRAKLASTAALYAAD